MAGISGQDAWGGLIAYIDATLKGAGALKGKDGANCTIESVLDIDGKHIVTFKWTDDSGASRTSVITIADGLSAYELAVASGYSGSLDEWLESLKGEKGETGAKGVGIESITKQSTSGLVDTYLIMFADGTTTTYDVVNGANVTKTSQLTNDSNFVDSATISLINYYMKDEVYNKAKIDELLRNIGAGLAVKIVATLPSEEISGTTIYLINTTGSNYNQYMYIDGAWASLGSTSVDLSSYYNKTQIDNMLLGYVTSSILLTQLMAYVKTSELGKVAKSNDYNDLDNLPNIPDVSGIKPYASELQDSENTAPTSKVLYDAVQTINKSFNEKLEDYALSESVGDLAELKTTEKGSVVGATNELFVNLGELSDSLVDIEDELGELSESKLANTFEINKIDPNDLIADKSISINYYTGDSTYSSKPIPTASGFLITLCRDHQYARQIWVHMRTANDTNVSRIWSRAYYNNQGWFDWVEIATMDKVNENIVTIDYEKTTETTPYNDFYFCDAQITKQGYKPIACVITNASSNAWATVQILESAGMARIWCKYPNQNVTIRVTYIKVS